MLRSDIISAEQARQALTHQTRIDLLKLNAQLAAADTLPRSWNDLDIGARVICDEHRTDI